jgi:hypothetical protein
MVAGLVCVCRMIRSALTRAIQYQSGLLRTRAPHPRLPLLPLLSRLLSATGGRLICPTASSLWADEAILLQHRQPVPRPRHPTSRAGAPAIASSAFLRPLIKPAAAVRYGARWGPFLGRWGGWEAGEEWLEGSGGKVRTFCPGWRLPIAVFGSSPWRAWRPMGRRAVGHRTICPCAAAGDSTDVRGKFLVVILVWPWIVLTTGQSSPGQVGRRRKAD